MTNKHRIYFFFWKIWVRLQGFKVGTIVKVYSEEKSKFIKGCVTSIGGDSIDDLKHCFYIGVNFFEPTQDFDSRLYSWGSYNPNNFALDPVDKIYYKK